MAEQLVKHTPFRFGTPIGTSKRDPLGKGLALPLLALMLAFSLGACQSAPDAGVEEVGQEAPLAQANAETGTLEFWANGEDFIREGFVSKDGWELSFEHVYVTLADITAYQTNPPFDPEGNADLQAQALVSLSGPITVDLVTAPPAERVLLGSLDAPPGHYNALSWRLVPAVSGPAKGYSLWLQGTARPAEDPEAAALLPDNTIAFVLKFSPELAFTCGEYVGEERKGFVRAGQVADLEATFHFDHLFGDGDLPPEDSLNQGALGFAPLVAEGSASLEIDWANLQDQQHSSTDANRILEILRELGHVGEGHCRETATNS